MLESSGAFLYFQQPFFPITGVLSNKLALKICKLPFIISQNIAY